MPVRYIKTTQYVASADNPKGNKDYGLARARNEAAIEATGDILVFVDQRNVMNPDCVEEFVKYSKARYWLFGDKGAGKKSFVENLSSVYKQDFINAGMFNERMNVYGGLSQETRHRVRNQGMSTEFIKSAKATAVGKSSNRNTKRQEILKSKTRLWKMGLAE
jgi:glycosyltransferase involved in cell wall biosynthesis